MWFFLVFPMTDPLLEIITETQHNKNYDFYYNCYCHYLPLSPVMLPVLGNHIKMYIINLLTCSSISNCILQKNWDKWLIKIKRTCGVEDFVLINNISFQNWTNNDHVVLFGKLLKNKITATELSQEKLGAKCNLISNWCTSWHNLMVDPSWADSANSVQGCFSRVQKANGIAIKKKMNPCFRKHFYFTINKVI